MHYADINAALIKSGHPPSVVADALKVSPTAVSRVIHGGSKSYNIASYIAVVTNIPLKRLWPDGRYDQAPKAGEAAA